MDTNDFGYAYDPIGNRELSRMNANTNHYLANELNQYLSVTSVSSVVNLSYDPDGNLTNDGTRAYEWDGENRLIRVEWGTNAVENTYDYMSRRIAKNVSVETTGHWSQVTGHSFLYDGWNMIRELVTDNGSPVTNSYTWGLDLSSTMQGAGGIGGLLSVSVAGVGDPGPFFPSYDANGNVAAYTSTNGTLVARYDYDAYGNVLAQSGSLADAFVYKFSTKYTDAETALVYYGFRYYAPNLGRWLNREPLGESVDANLFRFLFNRVLEFADYLGLQPITWVPPTNPPARPPTPFFPTGPVNPAIGWPQANSGANTPGVGTLPNQALPCAETMPNGSIRRHGVGSTITGGTRPCTCYIYPPCGMGPPAPVPGTCTFDLECQQNGNWNPVDTGCTPI